MTRNSSLRRRALALASVVALVGGLAACAGTDAGPDDDDTGAAGELNIQFSGPPVSLNPALAAAGGSTPYTYLAYDPLIYMDPAGALVPDLATSWEFVDDQNTVFELELREGVTFASGAEFDAAAAKASMDYFLSAGGMMISGIGSIDAIEAVDDFTLQITYAEPFPDAAITMTQYFQIGAIIGPDGIADPESLLTSSDGTGQYIYNGDESVTDSVYVYDRNPEYWAPEAQVFETVRMNVITDPNAALAAVTTGQVDFVSGSTLTADAAESAGMEIVTAPNFIWGLQIVDREGVLNPALGDERVRQAMQLALDREAIVEAVGGGFAIVNGQVVNEGVPGWVDGLGAEYDLDAAKELLAEAGYADGFTLKIATSPSLDPQSLYAQAFATSLQDLGVTVEIQVESTGLPRMLERSEAREFETLALPVSGRDAGDSIIPLLLRANLNPWGVRDEQIDELYSESLVATGDERVELFEQMNERWNELAWVLPAFSAQNIYYVSPDITNVRASGLNPNPVPIGPALEYAWQPAS